jgi:polyhydroxybutyrate depolymerase
MKGMTAAVLLAAFAGCRPGLIEPMAGTQVWEIVSGGEKRTVLVHPPREGGTELPVLLAFHGGYGTAVAMERYGLSALADREGFIAVYPQGLNRQWNDGRTDPGDISDVIFVQAVLDSLGRRYSVDTARVYATGMSNGGMFCHFLAVKMPGVLAGIAPVCAGIADPGYEWFTAGAPLGVLIIQGTDDPLVPYQGGGVGFRAGRGNVLGTEAAVLLWRGVNSASEHPETTPIPDASPNDGCTATAYLYRGIRNVCLVRIDGGGHVWPGSDQYLPPGVVGRACMDFDASEYIWNFFAEESAGAEDTAPSRSAGSEPRFGGGVL